jgi:hypothetical protein
MAPATRISLSSTAHRTKPSAGTPEYRLCFLRHAFSGVPLADAESSQMTNLLPTILVR